MKTYRLALIGFGNVGQGLAEILRDRGEALGREQGVAIVITAVSDLLKGSVYDPQGLDSAELLTAVQRDGSLAAVSAPYQGWDALRTIADSNADVIVELSYTDLATGQPALRHIETALANGKHVITTNKGPIALRYPELAALAAQNGVQLGVEGTVMSGTPALRLGAQLLAAAGVQRVQGILNGTTNYILTQMEQGASYADALADAQSRGYAEADPTGDVEGIDAAGKVVILANMLMGQSLTMADVQTTGISGLTAADVAAAAADGERWKLVGTVEVQEGGQVTASVQPLRLPLAHPLATVSGATNAITYATDLLGDVTLVGPGAGRTETGYALIADLLSLARAQRN